MKLSISGAIENDRVLGSALRRASQILERAIGSSSASAAAEWSLEKDPSGRPLVHLALSDYTGARAEARFAPDELANESRVEARSFTIWGDVLQVRSQKMIDQLLGKTQPGE